MDAELLGVAERNSIPEEGKLRTVEHPDRVFLVGRHRNAVYAIRLAGLFVPASRVVLRDETRARSVQQEVALFERGRAVLRFDDRELREPLHEQFIDAEIDARRPERDLRFRDV